jgi:hypothetical protein
MIRARQNSGRYRHTDLARDPEVHPQVVARVSLDWKVTGLGPIQDAVSQASQAR